MERLHRQGGGRVGIENPGNLCYRNAVVILLLNAEPFVAYVISEHPQSCKLIPDDCLLCHFGAIARAYWPEKGQVQGGAFQESVDKFWSLCETNGTTASWQEILKEEETEYRDDDGNFEQQDAHLLLEWMVNAFREQHFGHQGNLDACERMHQLLYIEKEQRDCCNECGDEVGQVIDQNCTLEVFPPSWARNKRVTVTDCLNNWQLEELKPENFVLCEKCESRTRTAFTRRLTFLPDIVLVKVIVMYYGPDEEPRKANKVFRSDESIDFSSWTASQDEHEETEYQMVGAISHHGKQVYSGHYIASVRQHDGSWNAVDDDSVNDITYENVMQGKASSNAKVRGKGQRMFVPYVYMYVKKSLCHVTEIQTDDEAAESKQPSRTSSPRLSNVSERQGESADSWESDTTEKQHRAREANFPKSMISQVPKALGRTTFLFTCKGIVQQSEGLEQVENPIQVQAFVQEIPQEDRYTVRLSNFELVLNGQHIRATSTMDPVDVSFGMQEGYLRPDEEEYLEPDEEEYSEADEEEHIEPDEEEAPNIEKRKREAEDTGLRKRKKAT
ncbi:MAG: hypothetical protein Q9227_004672 [Pyrenula ochraceoflavens]